MTNELTFPDEESAHLSNFGIFHLNIGEAAIFVVKCLWANDGLYLSDTNFYDQHFDDAEFVIEFRNTVSQYTDIIVKGIESGNLTAALLKRDISETIINEKTFLEIDDLAEFFSERDLTIRGDKFAEYAEEQSKLLDLAVTTIRYGVRDGKSNIDQQTKDNVLYLEQRIDELEKQIRTLDRSKTLHLEKPLHTKERETLLKLIIGMAVDGYGYIPTATRSPIPRELTDALAGQGISIDQDTVRKWLKNASDFMPTDFENPDS